MKRFLVVSATISLLLGCSSNCPPPIEERKASARLPAVLPLTPTMTHVDMLISGLSVLMDDPPGSTNRTVLFPVYDERGSTDVHEAFLFAEPMYVDSTDSTNGWTPMTPVGSSSPVIFVHDLKGEEILLANTTGWQSPSLVYTESATPAPIGNPCAMTPIGSLHWLPRMSEVAGIGLSLKTKYTAKPPLASDVAMRMEVVGGALAAHTPTVRDIYEFKASPIASPTTSQVVADGVDLLFDVKLGGTPLELSAKPFNGSARTIVKLIPDGAGNIKLGLGNLVKATFFKPTHPAFDPHFHHQYELFNESVVPPIIPFRTYTSCPPSGDGVNCGPDRVP
jgi:hypothetical protein